MIATRGRADQTVQHRLIKHDRHVGRVSPVEDRLTVKPCAYQRVYRLV
jgi:hypothetical protein